ncbi:MAG: MBL fold metallo-hydrolase [Gammaproteobacteria bacterium]|jgi:glyoxylase-like metal-dependent hydrolase (beta-lactamase superfamily II)|nr:MBL fold metallo-hydrolase [Gammaproteobacteria bacterium]
MLYLREKRDTERLSIVTIDTHYLDRREFAAAYLLIDGDRAAFIDNNTNAAVPRLLATLDEHGLTPAQVEFIIVTHVHLDHAGGTSALASACPDATVIAHPRAAPHVIDPDRLVKSASAVYGDAEFKRLYGDIEPISADRVRSMDDNEVLGFGTRQLQFLHTRGHANHHFCVVDSATDAIFTGDAFGLIYPALQRTGPFGLPSTSPTDFEPALARDAVRRLVDAQPTCLYPTHFGPVKAIEPLAGQLLRHLDFAEGLLDSAASGDLQQAEIVERCRQRVRDYLQGELDALGDLGTDPATWALLDLDINLNAQGIAFAAEKRRRKAREAARSNHQHTENGRR